MKIPFLLVGSLVAFLSCNEPAPSSSDNFAVSPQRTAVQPGLVDEASGMVASRTMNGYLWVEEDSDTPAQINLMTTDGQLVKRLPLPGLVNRDWEDLAIGPGPQNGVSYLYMGDIGDNNAVHEVSYIYRFPEPKSADEAITGIEKITFKYPDGPRDAEALFLDPQTKDLWIVSKREEKVHLYTLPYPQSTSGVITATYRGEIPLSLITGASISRDGNEILLESYIGRYHWRRKSGQSVADALQRNSYKGLTVDIGMQGEAVCFDKDDKGYYTLPEKGNAASVTLNYYKRL